MRRPLFFFSIFLSALVIPPVAGASCPPTEAPQSETVTSARKRANDARKRAEEARKRAEASRKKAEKAREKARVASERAQANREKAWAESWEKKQKEWEKAREKAQADFQRAREKSQREFERAQAKSQRERERVQAQAQREREKAQADFQRAREKSQREFERAQAKAQRERERVQEEAQRVREQVQREREKVQAEARRERERVQVEARRAREEAQRSGRQYSSGDGKHVIALTDNDGIGPNDPYRNVYLKDFRISRTYPFWGVVRRIAISETEMEINFYFASLKKTRIVGATLYGGNFFAPARSFKSINVPAYKKDNDIVGFAAHFSLSDLREQYNGSYFVRFKLSDGTYTDVLLNETLKLSGFGGNDSKSVHVRDANGSHIYINADNGIRIEHEEDEGNVIKNWNDMDIPTWGGSGSEPVVPPTEPFDF